MRETELKTQPSNRPWFCKQDARNRDIANASHYPDSKKAKAEGMKFALELVYAAENIYINYRQKFIAVKVDAPLVKNKRELSLLEEDWEKDGITKVKSAQGVVYRIPA